ncbi:DUF4339 domain-containing protein [Novipirellula sp. SH528]|uniref:DUF4339 domain-containing protein n=1 Tax=Novipirellula sp. SH528 TaxID=3454466 RepID=UPI003FA09A80
MGAGWYYITSGWLRKTRRMGPISEADLLQLIDEGKIAPDTLLLSSKTKGKWVPMNSIAPAIQRWNAAHSKASSD